MGFKLYNATPEVENFLKEWQNDSSTIVAHTSGSTGRPKQILLSKSDMIKSAEATCRFFRIDENSTLLLPLSPHYIAGKMMIVRTIITGASLWIEKPSNRVDVSSRVYDLVPMVVSQLENFVESYENYGLNVRQLLIGGSAVPPAVESKLKTLSTNIYVSYGMTETCSHVALRSINRNENFFSVIDDSICFSVDERQCLVIKTPDYTYSPIVTNDVVSLIDDKRFVYRGRVDNVIISGGVKIFPEEVEAEIRRIFPDLRFYISWRRDNKWGQQVVLVVDINERINSDALSIISEHLPAFSVPKSIVRRRFNFTDSGKILRETDL